MLTSRIRSFHGTVHVPVLLAEVISALRDNNCRQILDSTFGGGGYSRAALGIKNTLFSSIELFPNSFVWAIDRDPMAISRAATLPDKFNGRFLAKQASFSEIDTIFGKDLYFDAIMFDLGVSSDQVPFLF
jgi:16S rRNA (cytosine1402-N4)-methyltransferase